MVVIKGDRNHDRWYDPSLGRFIQPDSIVPGAGNPQAWNRYAYVTNRPLNHSDPSGHRPIIDEDEYGNPIVDPDWRLHGHSGGSGVVNNGGGDGYNPENYTYHLHSDTNLYMLGWQNFGSAWSIYSNPNATILQRAGAGYYMGAWGGYHVVGAVGVAGVTAGAAKAVFWRTALACIGSGLCRSVTGMAGGSGSTNEASQAGTEWIQRIHGNSLDSPRKTFLYQITDKYGNHLKYGITSQPDPLDRYSRVFMKDKILNILATGSRRAMYQLENEMILNNPRGPLQLNNH